MRELANSMIGKMLVTKQTSEAGKICNSVMVTARMFPRKEYYMAVMLERTFDVSINYFCGPSEARSKFAAIYTLGARDDRF